MNQSKQKLLALEDAAGQRLLPERRAYNERLAYFESGQASLEELYADFFTDYPLLEGGGWFSQANIVECMTLFGKRMVAIGKLVREMYLVYSTSTLRGGDGSGRMYMTESDRKRLMMLAKRCDDIDYMWSKNPVRARLQQDFGTPEGLQTFQDIRTKQETTSSWSSMKSWLGSWVTMKNIALIAFAYWFWWKCPTVVEDGLEKQACAWVRSIVDTVMQYGKDALAVSMGTLTDAQKKEQESTSRWWGSGAAAAGAVAGGFACGVGSLFTVGLVGAICVVGAGAVGGGVGYYHRSATYESNTVAANTTFLNTIVTIIVAHKEVFGGVSLTFAAMVGKWMNTTQPIRDINTQRTVMKKEMFDGAIGALAAAHPLSNVAFQGYKKGEDQFNSMINPGHVHLQKKVREKVDVMAKPARQWVAKQANKYRQNNGDVDDGLDVEDDDEAFREWNVNDVLQILKNKNAMRASGDQVVAWLTWKRDKIVKGANKSKKIRGYLQTFQKAPYKSVRAVFAGNTMAMQVQ